MNHKIIYAVMLCTAIALHVQSQEVGTLPGSFAVSPTGAATYSIPIDLPGGRAGMTPSLAFVYSSQGGNNIIGPGWSLTGFSSISRTNPTLYYNGEMDNIDFENDQLLLDGQPLIETFPESNEFRTEIDEISRIVYLEGGYGWYFEVFTKSGLVKEYGNSDNSRQVYSGNNRDNIPLIWHLTRVYDRLGNSIEYKYFGLQNQGELHPVEIRYTKDNTPQKTDDGFYVISFHYRDVLPDSLRRTGYFEKNGGLYLNQNTMLLDYIQIYHATTGYPVVKEYICDYYYAESLTKEYFLKKITLRVPSGNEYKSLNATSFDWNFYQPGYDWDQFLQEDDLVKIPTSVRMMKLDALGTNIDEIAVCKRILTDEEQITIIDIFSANQQLSFDPIPVNKNNTTQPCAGDFNNDGDDELLFIDDQGIKMFDFIQGGNPNTFGAQQVFNYNEPGYPSALPYVGDINGDGNVDLLVAMEAQCDLFTGTGQQPDYLVNTEYSIQLGSGEKIAWLADFSGDGKTDVLIMKENVHIKLFSYSEQQGFINYFTWLLSPTGDSKYYYGDFNADGKTDICKFNHSGTNWNKTIRFSFGDGFTPEYNPGSDIPPYFPSYAGDLNNDDRADFLYLGSSAPYEVTLRIDYTLHDGLHAVNGYSDYFDIGPDNLSIACFTVADLNGHGYNDIALECWSPSRYAPNPPFNELRLFGLLEEPSAENTYEKDLLISVTNGFDVTTSIGYQSFSQTGPSFEEEYPLSKFNAKLYLAKETYQVYSENNRINRSAFTFSRPVYHKQGKGLLGYRNVIVEDFQSNVKTSTSFDFFVSNNNYYLAYPCSTEAWTLPEPGSGDISVVLSLTENTLSVKNTVTGNDKIFLPVITENLQKFWDSDMPQSFIKTVKTTIHTNDMDEYGNVKKQMILTDANDLSAEALPDEYGFSTSLEQEFIYDLTHWIVGRPQWTVITKTAPGDPNPDVVRTDYQYFAEGEEGIHNNRVKCWPLLKNKTDTPNNDNNFMTNSYYEYDKYGNTVWEELTAPNATPPIAPRVVKSEYDENLDGRFLTRQTTSTDNLPFVTGYSYDEIKGLLESETNPENLTTWYSYDPFGKPTSIEHPDHTFSEIHFGWCEDNPEEPEGALFYKHERKKSAGSASVYYEQVYTYYNPFEQELRTVTQGLHDRRIYSDMIYDDNARLWKVSEPYFSTENQDLWTQYSYDTRNRIKEIITPANRYTLEYSGRTTRSTDQGTGISVEKTVDALGNTVNVTDPSGTVTYGYYASGKVKQTEALGAVSSFGYDAMGNQILLTEPNAGTLHYTYDPFSQLTGQTDARGNTYQMAYDDLGRLRTKTLVNTAEATTYSYQDDPGLPGFGKLRSMSGANGITYSYSYDSLSRLASEDEFIDNTHFTTSYAYSSSHGKLITMTYSSGFTISYAYEPSTGFLHSVIDPTHSTNLWVATDANARGQLTDFTLGNGLSTDKTYDAYGYLTSIATPGVQSLSYQFDPVTGNLNYRIDNLINRKENFGYDDQLKNRLIWWQVEGLQMYVANYFDNGNIQLKTDVTTPGNPGGWYQYGNNPVPHAVTGVTYPTLDYLIHASAPQEISYTAFNKVECISKWDWEDRDTCLTSHGDYTLTVTYGPDENRKRTDYFAHGYHFKTKFFISSHYEEEITSLGVRKLHYISTGDGLFAIYEIKNGTGKMYYIHKDHLGSYESITDSTGAVVERLSFDPWGRRRNPTNWSYDYLPYPPPLFDRGHTGHEYLDVFGLINMNGRVYDPWLGRFLSPDPFVQAPENGQSYNRYSYCLNNPLKYVDPEGEFGILAALAVYWGAAAIMGGTFWGFQGNDGFNWGDAGMGAISTLSLAIGMTGAGLAPFLPAMAGISGFLGSAAMAGGSAFVSTALVTGSQSWMTSDVYKPNWAAAGIAGGLAGLFAGIEGGMRARVAGGNFWTGKPQAIGRSPFSFNNIDRYNTFAFGGSNEEGYHALQTYKYHSNLSLHSSHESCWYGRFRDFTGQMHRWLNTVAPVSSEVGISFTKSIDIRLFKGSKTLVNWGYLNEGTSINVFFDGSLAKTYISGFIDLTAITIPANVQTLTISVVGSPLFINSTISPVYSFIQGWTSDFKMYTTFFHFLYP